MWVISKTDMRVFFPHRIYKGHGKGSSFSIVIFIMNWLSVKKTIIPSSSSSLLCRLFLQLRTKNVFLNSSLLSSYIKRVVCVTNHCQFVDISSIFCSNIKYFKQNLAQSELRIVGLIQLKFFGISYRQLHM